jgi:biopolymer transport protein ExbD
MRYARNAKIFRGQLDVTPFAGVFFCLVLFLVLSSLVYTSPGIVIHLPTSAAKLPMVEGRTLPVAVDPSGRIYYQNQIIQTNELFARLREEVRKSSQPLVLVLEADKSVTLETLLHLTDLASTAGVSQIVEASLPRVFDSPSDR